MKCKNCGNEIKNTFPENLEGFCCLACREQYIKRTYPSNRKYVIDSYRET